MHRRRCSADGILRRPPPRDNFLACAAKKKGWGRRARNEVSRRPRLISSVLVTRVLYDMLCFSNFIGKYMVSSGTQVVLFYLTQFPKVRLDSVFFIIQTGPKTPLYANSSLSRCFFSPLCSRFLLVRRTSGYRGGGNK